jgi:hypothetical protein
MRTTRSLLATIATASIATLTFAGTAAAQDQPAAQPAPAAGDSKLPPLAADAKPQPPPPSTKPVDDDRDDADDEKDDGKDEGDDEDGGKKKHHHKKKEHDHARFRGGISAYGGAYVFAGHGIPYGGIEGRLGVQIKDWVAVYAEPAFLVGAALGNNGGGVVARASIGVIPEFTIADLWFIGAGPEIYAVAGGAANSNTGGVFFAGGSIVGINARTGFAFGSKRPGRRKCFTIALDMRLDFFRGDTVTIATGSETVGNGVGFVPGLSLGYDAM